MEKCFVFLFPLTWGRVSHKRQERGYLIENGKWKVENCFVFFISPPLGEGVAQAIGEGLLSHVIARG